MVTTIIADIATASAEQATGLDEINNAMAQMDEVTQQNSDLVEENATAKTLEHQVEAMDEQVAFFQLGPESGSKSAEPTAQAKAVPVVRLTPVAKAKPVAAPKRVDLGGGGPVGRMQTALATTVKSDSEWKEF